MSCAKSIAKWHQEMGFTVANDVNEALEMAIKEKGKDAHISIIPDGVSVNGKKTGIIKVYLKRFK